MSPKPKKLLANRISTTNFNENISKYIKLAKEGEVFFITSHSSTHAVLIGKSSFDVLISIVERMIDEE